MNTSRVVTRSGVMIAGFATHPLGLIKVGTQLQGEAMAWPALSFALDGRRGGRIATVRKCGPLDVGLRVSRSVGIIARMMHTKIKVVNNLDFNIQVKEGNAGTYRLLTVLGPGQSCKITIDKEATYREYIMIQLPHNEELRKFSSEDVQEFKRIEIQSISGKIDWVGIKRSWW